jgi:hypothetical protein
MFVQRLSIQQATTYTAAASQRRPLQYRGKPPTMPSIRNERQATARAAPYTTNKPNAKATKPPSESEFESEDEPLSDAQNAQNFILESEFVALEAALPPKALGDLKNDVLPIFKHANFPEISENVYKSVILPCARLASLLLQHPSLHLMFRTILDHGDLIAIVGEEDSAGKQLFSYPANPRPITTADIDLIRVSLHELGDFVKFNPDPEIVPTTAHTKMDTEGPRRPNEPLTPHLSGRSSTINYCPKLLSKLTRATSTLRTTRDTPLLLAWRFHLAVQLAHETCHALTFAKDGRLKHGAADALDTDPFFPDAPISEVGFTMEVALFGGHPAFLWDTEPANATGACRVHRKSARMVSNFVGVPVVWAWPCTWLVKDYASNNLSGMDLRAADRVALADVDFAWRTPMAGLARFFQTEFWRDAEPVLRLERSVGFAFTSDDGGEREPCVPEKAVLRNAVPAGYRISKHKAIVKRK